MGYKIIVHTCKSHPLRPLIDGKTGTELVWEWLKNNDMTQYVSDVVWGKPHAMAYIDDKAISFIDWATTLKSVKLLRKENSL